MATKKDKRAAALAKREKFLAEETAIGLRAQQEDQQQRAERQEQALLTAEELNQELNRRLANIFIRGFES